MTSTLGQCFDNANDIFFEIAPSTDLSSLADMPFEGDLHVLDKDGMHSTPRLMPTLLIIFLEISSSGL